MIDNLAKDKNYTYLIHLVLSESDLVYEDSNYSFDTLTVAPLSLI